MWTEWAKPANIRPDPVGVPQMAAEPRRVWRVYPPRRQCAPGIDAPCIFFEDGDETMVRRRTFFNAAKALLGFVAAMPFASQAHADVLDDVKANGTLKCGVTLASAGFSAENNAGKREGFDIDLCKAIAAAALGDETKIQLTPMDLKTAFAGLPAGAVDVLTHRFTWTQSRDVGGLKFPKIMFFAM